MDVCILGSGSSGNCVYLGSPEGGVLIDAGMSRRQILLRLQAVGANVSALHGICLSHEHDDHVSAVRLLHQSDGIPLYANAGTAEGVNRAHRNRGHQLAWRIFETGQPFAVGPFTVEPFSVPHDAYEPVGFLVRQGRWSVGVVTDLGMMTTLVRQRLKGCHALVLEANHDPRLVTASRRPWSLKQRILGRQGHLSNEDAALAIGELAHADLQCVFLAHLSSECNRPNSALQGVNGELARLGFHHVHVAMSYPERPSLCWQLESMNGREVIDRVESSLLDCHRCSKPMVEV